MPENKNNRVKKMRVVFRFFIIATFLLFTIGQFVSLVYLIMNYPAKANLLSSVVMLSLPASIVVIGGYVGIDAAKMRRGFD